MWKPKRHAQLFDPWRPLRAIQGRKYGLFETITWPEVFACFCVTVTSAKYSWHLIVNLQYLFKFFSMKQEPSYLCLYYICRDHNNRRSWSSHAQFFCITARSKNTFVPIRLTHTLLLRTKKVVNSHSALPSFTTAKPGWRDLKMGLQRG